MAARSRFATSRGRRSHSRYDIVCYCRLGLESSLNSEEGKEREGRRGFRGGNP